MKEINIRPQPRLGLSRTFLMTVRGVRYRLFRSIVTVVVITVAIAFLMNIVTESLIKKELAENSRRRIQELRLGLFWLTRLSVPAGDDEILASLAESKPGDPVFREAINFGALNEKAMEKLAAHAAAGWKLVRFFEELDYGRRRLLVGRAWGLGILDALQEPEARRRLQLQLKEMRGLRFPLPAAEFDAFMEEWPGQRAALDAIREGWQKAVEKVASASKDSLLKAMADMRGAFGEAVRAAGFVLDPTTAETISRQAQRILMTKELERAIDLPELKKAIAARMNILPREVTMQAIWRMLEDRGSAEWLSEELNGMRLEPPFTREDLVAMAEAREEETSLARAEQLPSGGGGFLGMGERTGWLIIVSLGVCVVGITNAMFMSVTERYREIATMKCLGALDGTIMLIFVLEAALLGLSGGMVGAMLGVLVAVGRLFLSFGSLIAGALPAGPILAALAAAAGVGVLLAAIGAVFPSYKAARLAPMEAMRIE